MVSSRRSRMVVMGLSLGAVALVAIYLVVNRPQMPGPSAAAPGAMTAADAPTSPLTTTMAGENAGLHMASPLTAGSTVTADSTAVEAGAVDGEIAHNSTREAAITGTVTTTTTPSAASIATQISPTAPSIAPSSTPTPTVRDILMPILPKDGATTTPAAPATPTASSTPARASTATPAPTRAPPAFDEAVDVPIYDYSVVAIFPHDPEAFTQGLQYVDGVFYEGTGLRSESSLRRVEPETGEVLQQIALAAQYFGEGIAVVDERIYQLTWESRTGFVYDRTTFEQIDEFQYPTEGWGLTYDGEHLIMSDGTATLYHRDPATFEEVDRVTVKTGDVTVPQLNELEYIEGEVFANVWRTDWIVRIDPATGDVLGWIDLAGLLAHVDVTQPVDVLNGIAFDADEERIFVTGKWWPALFEIELATR